MDSNTTNLITTLVTSFFSSFVVVHTSAKSRKINCCGVVETEVEMKDDEEKK